MTRTWARSVLLALALTAATLTASCSSAAPAADPAMLLTDAQQTLAATQTLHFALSSSDLPTSGTVLVSGEGDVKRPDELQGSFTARTGGFTAPVEVVATGGTFYAKLPLTSSFVQTDPTRLGFGDPATLFGSGVDQLLQAAQNPTLASRDRLDGELLDEVEVTLPGDAVAGVLRSADPSRPVQARIGITADTPHQVRRVMLTGPFYEGATTTYTIVLTKYGEPVQISAPTG